ncbi:MAG: hypothetical protein P8188_01625 [Gemmatimonadota bacterium]
MLRKILILVLALAPMSALAQEPGQLTQPRLLGTRAELEEQLAQLEGMAASRAYSDRLRRQAEEEAALLARRLEEGDFRVGDRVVLTVPGEGLVADTLQVVAGPAIVFPQIGAIELRGVLRAELQDHLTEELGRYIRDPDIRQADVLVGIGFVGAVSTQGIHYVPAEASLGDALRIPGLASNAKVEDVEILRGGMVIWDKEAVREAVQDFRSLDQLSLQAGDAVRVPQRADRSWLTWITVTASLITSITIIARVF